MSALPPVRNRHNVCVICEGYEDYHYFKRLIDLNVWDFTYSFSLINVKSASNIPARFQNDLCRKITRTNYPEMKRRVAEINFPDTFSGSTNISVFLNCFEASDDRWIAEIRKALS